MIISKRCLVISDLKGHSQGGTNPHFLFAYLKVLYCANQTKKRIEKYWFLTKLWPFEDAYFWCSQKTLFPRKPDLWRHLGHLFENQVFLSTDRGEEMAVEREQIDFRKISIYLFRRKMDRRIQKNRFWDLVISTTSGITSSITT